MISGTSGSIIVGAGSRAGDWFSQNLSDPGLQALARTDFNRDGSLTYSDMLGLFAEAESAGAITSAELQSLQALVTPSGAAAVNMASPVQSLTYKVVDGDPANAQYQGTALGNLQAGNPASHLQELVDKWFLGKTLPQSTWNTCQARRSATSLASGTLFGSGGPSYKDVYQGEEGDCWLLSSLAVTAAHDPSVIQSMFTSDGTQMENGVPVQVWTVRFYDNGVPSYLTVNNLPAGQLRQFCLRGRLPVDQQSKQRALGRLGREGVCPAMRVRLELPARVQRLCVLERRQRIDCPAGHHGRSGKLCQPICKFDQLYQCDQRRNTAHSGHLLSGQQRPWDRGRPRLCGAGLQCVQPDIHAFESVGLEQYQCSGDSEPHLDTAHTELLLGR